MRLRGASRRVGFSVRQSSLENQPDSQGGSCRTTGSRAEDFHVVRYANRAALGLSYTGTPRALTPCGRYGLGKESCTASLGATPTGTPPGCL